MQKRLKRQSAQKARRILWTEYENSELSFRVTKRIDRSTTCHPIQRSLWPGRESGHQSKGAIPVEATGTIETDIGGDGRPIVQQKRPDRPVVSVNPIYPVSLGSLARSRASVARSK